MIMKEHEDHKAWVKYVTALYILKLLKKASAHGNKLAEEIRRRTEDTLKPNPNFLYPLLRSMEERGYVVGEWSNPTTRNKRVYTLTAKGNAQIPELEAKVCARLLEIERKLALLRQDLLK